ncbi:MAG: 6-chlorohydroxyquinol-1,2-dioxygenase [Candidatus Saccharibacteria bacterium]|nr:6-chlorohydroxyquinol-1,2-dioxygenase [Pseudorhodobacter sp.]
MTVITRKLHEAVKLHEAAKEVEPTQDEWFTAIQFLTATGHTCTDWRQEFILLSDVLGEPMLVQGRILDNEGRPIAGARIDVWQANDEGFYDVQQKGIQPDFNLRDVFRTGADGRYWFGGVKPKFYPIPDDRPVGKLLAALGRHPYRPAHLHYIVDASGFDHLVTHIFDPDDAYIASDAAFSVKESLMARFVPNTGPKGAFLRLDFDFVLSRDSTTAGG